MKKARRFRVVNPYFLIKGEKWEDWQEPGKKKYHGQTRSINDLIVPTIEDAHKVAKIAGLEEYMIAPEGDTFGHDAVFKTKGILDYEARQIAASQEGDFRRTARLEKISQTKRVTVIRRFVNGTIVFAQRGKPEYRKGYSSKIQMSVQLYVKAPKNKAKNIWIDDFFTKDGKFLKKKFLDDWAYYFGGSRAERAIPSRYSRYTRSTVKGRSSVPGRYPTVLETLADDMPVIYQEYKALQRGQWSTQYNPGAAWHLGKMKLALGKKDLREGESQERMFYASKAQGLPNPKKKKSSLSGLVLISGIIGAIWYFGRK